MSNRRVKSLAVDDDDYDDFNEDYEDEDPNAAHDEMSPEDKVQMHEGTIKVRQALGTAFPVTDQDIQEALWHYYYDVSKSVAYLKNKQAPAPTATSKKPKEPKNIAEPSVCSTPFSAADFFQDCPWLRVPPHRKAEIIVEPLYPRQGLLGGSSKDGKMSKLAALAAKRRQQGSQPAKPDPTVDAPSQDDYTASLNKLRISKISTPLSGAQSSTTSKPKDPEDVEMKLQDTPHDPGAEKSDPNTDGVDQTTVVEPEIRGTPSAFATVLTNNPEQSQRLPLFKLFPDESGAKSFDFSEPSPDDLVTKAQNVKAPAPAPAKSKSKESTKVGPSIANGVQKLNLQELPKVKSKNIDVIAEYRKIKRKNAANFVVIGHVDAGKSTLMGRLLFELKAVDERTMQKYQKEAEQIGKGSFAFAWVLDQGTEERARGVTIDIATNNFATEKTNFTILDAPGHRDFVPNMIAGASQADFAVLVIDASPGNFESGLKGQTKEHALLVRSIGVQRLIVAVNKMDAADWSEDRFKEIQQQMAAFLSSAGFQAKNVTFVPCSGLGGGNVLQRTADPRALWYQGPTLVEDLDTSEPTTYALDKPLRMTIGDVFRGGVQNPLSVSGRLEAGNLQVGEQILIMPSGESAQIRSLEVDDEPLDWAVAGQNVVLNLSDLDPIHLKTGDVLCSPAAPIKNLTEFKAKVLAFDHLTPMNLDVHKGRLHVPGRITQLIGTLDKSSGAILKKRPKIVQPGSVVRVLVQLEQSVPLEAPARVVLRANGETVAAGLIE